MMNAVHCLGKSAATVVGHGLQDNPETGLASILTSRFLWNTKSRQSRAAVHFADAMKSDFEGPIAKVVPIGSKAVRFARHFRPFPKRQRLLKKNGLTSPSCHVPYYPLKKMVRQIEASHTHPAKIIVCPWIDPNNARNPMATNDPPIFSRRPARPAKSRHSVCLSPISHF